MQDFPGYSQLSKDMVHKHVGKPQASLLTIEPQLRRKEASPCSFLPLLHVTIIYYL